MDWSPPSFSVPGILQARILERVAVSSCRGSSWPRVWTHVSCIAGEFFTTQPPGIPSPPLALFLVILPEAHLTSHSTLSGSRWVITPSWLSRSLRSFLVFFCIFLLPLLYIFWFCSVHTISVLYCAHLCMKYSLGIFSFLEGISSLSHKIITTYCWRNFNFGSPNIITTTTKPNPVQWLTIVTQPLPLPTLAAWQL